MTRKIPEIIPNNCGECDYYKKTGIIDLYKGHCNFYNEKVYTSFNCIALTLLTTEEKISGGLLTQKPKKVKDDTITENVNAISVTKSESNQIVSEGGFFSFRKLISGTLIKILYVIGIIVITIGGILMIAEGSHMRYGGEGLILGGLALLILGNLLWRIICEGWIVIFSMHEGIISILNELKRK